jgi:hypothetical protein
MKFNVPPTPAPSILQISGADEHTRKVKRPSLPGRLFLEWPLCLDRLYVYRLLVHDKLIAPMPEEQVSEKTIRHRLATWHAGKLPKGHPLLG